MQGNVVFVKEIKVFDMTLTVQCVAQVIIPARDTQEVLEAIKVVQKAWATPMERSARPLPCWGKRSIQRRRSRKSWSGISNSLLKIVENPSWPHHNLRKRLCNACGHFRLTLNELFAVHWTLNKKFGTLNAEGIVQRNPLFPMDKFGLQKPIPMVFET